MVRIQPFLKRFQPSVGHLHIGIQQQVVLGVNPGESPVVTSRESVVPVQKYEPQIRESLPEHFHGTVRGGIVGNDDLTAPFVWGSRGVSEINGMQKGRKEFLKVAFPVPVQNDNGGLDANPGIRFVFHKLRVGRVVHRG